MANRPVIWEVFYQSCCSGLYKNGWRNSFKLILRAVLNPDLISTSDMSLCPGQLKGCLSFNWAVSLCRWHRLFLFLSFFLFISLFFFLSPLLFKAPLLQELSSGQGQWKSLKSDLALLCHGVVQH